MPILNPQPTTTVPQAAGPALVGFARAQEDLEFSLDFIEKSTRYRDPFIPIWDEVLDNYTVTPLGTGVDRLAQALGIQHIGSRLGQTSPLARARLKDPETHQIVETLASQGLGLLLGTQDYIKAVPIGVDDPEKARLISRLLQAILDRPGCYRTHYQIFKSSFLFGTAIVEVGWETRSRMQMVKQPFLDPTSGQPVIDPDTGSPVQSVVPQEIIYKDEPLIREVDLYDFYPDPSGTRIHGDMKIVAKRFRLTAAMAKELADTGVYDKEPTYKALAKASGHNNTSFSERGGPGKFPQLDSFLPPDKYGMLTGFELWGEVPYDRPDGRNRVITLLNGEIVRSHINPYIDGEIPFKEVVVNPIGGRFYGLSPAEVIRFLQDSADNFLMVFNDAGDLAIRGPLLVGTAFGGDIERIKERRLNDVIMCRNADAVKPVPVDLGALTFAAEEMARRLMRMREATGATNPLQAIPSSDRQTATEVSELVRLASQRVQTMVELIERDDYPWIGRMIHSRLRQFLPDGGAVARYGGDIFEATLEDIDVDADVRFVGSQQAQSQYQVAASLREAINVLGQMPQVVEQYPELVERYFRDGLKITDAKTIVANAVRMAQVLAMRGQPGAPAPGASPSAITPETFGTQAGETEQQGQRVA